MFTSNTSFVDNSFNAQTSLLQNPPTRRFTIDDLTFSTNDQSIWGNGPASTFKDNRFLGGSWNASVDKILINEKKVLGQVNVPKVGISESTNGKSGLQSDLPIQGGTVDPKLPIDILIDLPSQIKAGDQVSIKPEFTVAPKATFATNTSFVENSFNAPTSLLQNPPTRRFTIDDLTFSTNGQSIWGNGSAFTFKDNRFLGGSWNASGDKTLINEKKLFGKVIVPKVGISGSTSGKAGLQSDLTIQGGTVDAKLPIDIWIDLPSKIKAGDKVTIKSGFTVDPKATFSTLTPNAKYNLDLILALNAQAGFQVGSSNKNLVNVGIPEKRINILKLDGQNISKTVDIPGGYGSFGLKVPNLNATGTLGSDKKTLSSSKTDSFLNGNIDLDKIATSVLQKVGVPVPPLSGSVSANLGAFGGSFSYNLADLQLLAQLNLKQKFDLVANSLKGKLTLSNQAKTKLDFTVGQDLTFTAPTDIVGGKLDLSASVNLGANLKNTTTLGGNSSLDISALAGSVSGSILGINLGSAEFGPLYQKNVPIIGGDIATLYNDQFALGGFNTQTFNAGSILVV